MSMTSTITIMTNTMLAMVISMMTAGDKEDDDDDGNKDDSIVEDGKGLFPTDLVAPCPNWQSHRPPALSAFSGSTGVTARLHISLSSRCFFFRGWYLN